MTKKDDKKHDASDLEKKLEEIQKQKAENDEKGKKDESV